MRRPRGDIARVSFPLEPLGSRHRWMRLPVVRGVISLYESLVLGIQALGLAANFALEDPDAGFDPKEESNASPNETSSATAGASSAVAGASSGPAGASSAPTKTGGFGWKELTFTVVLGVGLAVVLFVVIPLLVVKRFEDTFSNPFLFNLVEGVIRIAIFVLYVAGVSLIPDLRRVFQYHGAEHKVIHAYEHCGCADPEKAKSFSTLHPRCGTGFLLLVLVVAVLVFALVGKPSLPWLILSRLVGIPLIIGISYEVGIKWAGKHARGLLARAVLWPGIQLQRLTTREPTMDQLEVAAAALDEVLRLDHSELHTWQEIPADT
ncbi:MAG: DUF1385 domain-containing protein [Thermoleophilia bacterium]|nr:DUF1385 domain-containing protein [Thermoleophilia bacterium]